MATKKSGISALSSLEKILQEYLVDKAPFQIPKNIKEVLVKIAPWLIIIMLVFAIPSIFAMIGFSSMMGGMGRMMGYGYGYGGYSSIWWVSSVLLVISMVFEIMALPGLFARTMQGWKYVFYAELIGIVASFAHNNVLGGLLSGVIGLYILFQVKEMYH